MSLFKHASEILQGKINHFLNNAEDPAETLDLSYEKMITNLQETKRQREDAKIEHGVHHCCQQARLWQMGPRHHRQDLDQGAKHDLQHEPQRQQVGQC